MEILRGKVALKKVGSIFEFSKKVMALWKEEKLMLKVIWMEPDRVEAAWCCRADEKPNNKIAVLELFWQFWDKNVTWGKPGRVESRGLWPHPPQQPWSNNLIATEKRYIKLCTIEIKKYQSFAYLKVHDVSGRWLIQFSPTLNSLERELYRRDAQLTWCCFLNLTQFLQFLTDLGNFEKIWEIR